MSLINPLALFIVEDNAGKLMPRFLAVYEPSNPFKKDSRSDSSDFYRDYYNENFEATVESMEASMISYTEKKSVAAGNIVTAVIEGGLKQENGRSMKPVGSGRFRETNYKQVASFLSDIGLAGFDFDSDETVKHVVDVYISDPVSVRVLCFEANSKGNSLAFADLKHKLENMGAEQSAAELGELLELEGFVIDDTHRILVTALDRLAKENGYANCFLFGASGTGKTTLAKKFAEATKRGFLDVNSASIQNPEEWFGYREAEDGSTVFVESELVRACREGGFVILLDEINRLEPANSNPLYEMLDDRRCITVHGEKVPVAPNTIFLMSANIGWQYVGTFPMDTALENRANMRIIMHGMTEEEEVEHICKHVGLDLNTAVDLVESMTKVRYQFETSGNEDTDLSVRTTLNIANLLKVGLKMKLAFTAVLGELDKNTLDLIN